MGEERARPKPPGPAPGPTTPSPAEVVLLGNTAVDGKLGARMAVGIAETAPHLGEPAAPDPGTRVRQFELIRELGRGGMGQVYLARDLRLARLVAIKFLATKSSELAQRFLAEARTTAALQHENIVVIHEVGQQAGVPHMVLEYLEGTSLRDVMSGRALTVSRVLELMLPVVRAVARAHAAGIVHRDLKPETVFVTVDGAIKVLDFGIAKALVDPAARAHRATVEELEHLTQMALTGKGAIIGTPQYMAPEQFGLDDVDHRSDLYAIGVILFELLTGRHPLAPVTFGALLRSAGELDEPMPRIGSVVADLPEQLERIVDRCLAKRKSARYPDASTLQAELETLLPGRFDRKLREHESPYPGLTAFQEEDAGRFFGRARDIARVASRLREHPIVGIAGPSGIGKSSLVRAGIVPALKASGDAWETYIVRPGRQPLASLAGAVAPLTSAPTQDGTRVTNPKAIEAYEGLVDRLTAEPGHLGELLRERAARKNTKILLFVDQLEELYTNVPDAAERRVFAAALAGAADDATSPVRVVVSIRSDFMDRVGEHRAFLDQLMRGLVFLQPLGRPELREALTRPLDAHGYRIDGEDLVEHMLDQVASAPGGLPLLQFAASQLWDRRDRKHQLITRAAHDAMGGIAGALATHADEVLASMPASRHGLVREIFQRLITPERTRALVDLADLEQLAADRGEVREIIDQLVTARLLVVQTLGNATVEIVHESLLTAWPTLRRWCDEDHEDTAFLAQLAASAKQWDARQRAPGLLWRGDAASDARRWFRQRPRSLPQREQAFLDAVFALARRNRRLRLAALAGVFVVLGGVATGASIAYVRVSAAERSATASARRAEDALAQKVIEENARHKAEDERTAALAMLLTEEQLRKAAEEGKLTAEQLAAILELRRRAAVRGLAVSEQQRAKIEAQLRDADEARRAAENEAAAKAQEAQLTREQLIEMNRQLDTALAEAKRESARADAARVEADKANTKLKDALKLANDRVKQLQENRSKIHGDDLK